MDKSIIKAALSLFSSSVVVQIINFLSQILLMRELSLSEFGIYSLSFEGLSMCNMIVSSAFRNYYMRELNKGTTIEQLLPYQFIYGSMWCCISTVVVGLLFDLNIIIIISMSLSMIVSSLILPVWVEFLVLGKRKRIIVRDITYAVATFIAVLFVSLTHAVSVYFLILVILALNSVVALIFFFGKKEFKYIFNLNKVKDLNSSIMPFFAIFIVNTIYNKIGVSFLNYFSDINHVAKYLATFKFITPLFFVQSALISSILPKLKKESRIEFDNKFFLFFAAPGLVISLMLPIVLPIVIKVFGIIKYNDIPYYMIFGSSVIFISFIYGSLSNYISIKGGQSLIIKTNVLGVIAYLLLLMLSLALPVKNHLIELCLSLFVITESLVCVKYYSEIKKESEITYWFLVSPLLIIAYEMIMIYCFIIGK